MHTVHFSSEEGDLVTYSAKANFKTLGKRLGANMKAVATEIEKLSTKDISSILDGMAHNIKFNGGDIDVTKDDLVVQKHEKENVILLSDEEISLALNVTITEALKKEGWIRDLVREIQNTRKESGFDVQDHIRLTLSKSEISDAIKDDEKKYISKETLSDSIEVKDFADGKEVDIDDIKVRIKVEKN